MEYQREPLLERRQNSAQPNDLWDQLSVEQQFAGCSLTQCGFELAYIRHSNAGNLAILLRDQQTATITDAGVVDTNSAVNIRN